MYNEQLASAILESLEAQYPDAMHFKDLRTRLPRFSDVSEQEWLKTLSALLRENCIDGVPLPDGPGIADLANITITPTGRSALRQQLNGAPSQSDDRRFEQIAIEEARKSTAEDKRPHPMVGVVVVQNGQILATAHRGEFPGCHGEYTALETKLKDVPLSGATVYTTLEPCTSRNLPKIPCAERLIARKVGRVVIGILDPDDRVHGRGQMTLRKANIATDFFAPDLMSHVEELNRDFMQDRESRSKQNGSTTSPLEIIFDARNPSKRFWSVEPVRDENGRPTGKPVWEYRVEIKNNSAQTLRDVLVTREHLGLLGIRPTDVVFDRTKENFCDINPHTSELAIILGWPIPTNQAGTLTGPSALEYGPIKLIASAADTLPTTKVFEFDHQREPMLRELSVLTPEGAVSGPAKNRIPRQNSLCT
jgi:pyrimidine deaminase RibD-like protein